MPHVNQCIQQLFGPLCGRSKTFYVRHRVVFEAESNIFQFVSLSIEDYGAFRFTSTSSFPFPSTYTERMFETLQKVTTANAKLLVKCGKLASSVHTLFPISLEGWRYISRWMQSFGEHVSINVRQTRTKHCITNANLSLLSEVLPTSKHTIVADSADGYNAVRSVFASTLGIGVKKRHPTLSAIKDPSKNPNTLQSTDTINMCDVEMSHDLECSSKEGIERKSNCIQFVYDTRSRECRMIMKCSTMNVGTCQAAPLLEYLHKNDIVWNNNSIQPGVNLEIHGELWVIQNVDSESKTVSVSKVFGTGCMEITMEECLDLVM